jgi:hypothetical protein
MAFHDRQLSRPHGAQLTAGVLAPLAIGIDGVMLTADLGFSPVLSFHGARDSNLLFCKLL